MTIVFMKPRPPFLLLGLFAIIVLTGCSSSPNDDSPAVEGRACFDSQRVSRFSPFDDRFVYVRVGSDEHYLLTVGGICPGLATATGISISSGMFSRICSDSGATITYRDAQMPCRITAVETVTSRDAAEEIVKKRTTPTAD